MGSFSSGRKRCGLCADKRTAYAIAILIQKHTTLNDGVGERAEPEITGDDDSLNLGAVGELHFDAGAVDG